ncbi:DNA methyltransferase, partial [Bacillus sp. SS-TM]
CRYTGKQYLQLPVVSLIRQLPLTGTKPVGNHIFLTSGFGNLFSRIAAEKFQEQQLEQPHHQLVASYDSLNRKYSELLDEFKTLRRYFSVSVSVPYTDVWTHKPVQFYPGKHPCEKPADMLRQIISASSRQGDLVADFFMGSGSTIKAAMALGAVIMSIVMAGLRIAYFGGGGGWKRKTLEIITAPSGVSPRHQL